MANEIESIIEFGTGKEFLEINNSVGQRWYLPYKKTRKFLSLFRPSSAIGKVVRFFIPIIKCNHALLSALKMKRVKLSLATDIRKRIEEAFNEKNLEFAFFCGSPGRHRKTTIMIRNSQVVLGYCKATCDKEIAELFKKEKEALSFLHKKGIKGVPTILYSNGIKELPGIWLHIQTTTYSQGKGKPNIYSRQVVEFIHDIQTRTGIVCNYEESDYSYAIASLKKNYSKHLEPELQSSVASCIKDIECFLKSENRIYNFSHGDFTPWNCLISNDGLFTFDFEYCHKSYTPYYDFFHFYTQSSIYDNFWDDEKIYEGYKRLQSNLLDKYIPIELSDIYYKCYLLGIIEFYLSRDNGILNNRIKESIKIWVSIIKRINNG